MCIRDRTWNQHMLLRGHKSVLARSQGGALFGPRKRVERTLPRHGEIGVCEN